MGNVHASAPFLASLQAATSRLTQPASSPAEFAEHLAFLAQCEAGKAAMDREYDVVGPWGAAGGGYGVLAAQTCLRGGQREHKQPYARPLLLQVVAHYDLMEDFGIQVPDMQVRAYLPVRAWNRRPRRPYVRCLQPTCAHLNSASIPFLALPLCTFALA